MLNLLQQIYEYMSSLSKFQAGNKSGHKLATKPISCQAFTTLGHWDDLISGQAVQWKQNDTDICYGYRRSKCDGRY